MIKSIQLINQTSEYYRSKIIIYAQLSKLLIMSMIPAVTFSCNGEMLNGVKELNS